MNLKKVILIILDGWGIAENKAVSAIDAAETPFFDYALENHPNATLRASEEWVGLPKGQMGNSEVGHMNIGAGRVVYQELVRISKAFETGTFSQQKAYQNMVRYCRENDKPLHLMGLLSDGGVHSHIEHLKSLISQLAKDEVKNVFVHAFMDGRDADPHGGKNYMKDLEEHMKREGCGKIASVIGRYYSMDRDQRWGRIRKAYDLLINGKGKSFNSAEEAIRASYDEGITDEFIEPVIITNKETGSTTISENDAVFFFNFRTDRGRQLTEVLTQKSKLEYNLHKLDLHYTTMTVYNENFHGVNVVFRKEEIKSGLGEVLTKANKKQIRIAETEKYAHVTFFFSGGNEKEYEGEKRILCASPKVATYDLQPEMSAAEIQGQIIPELEKAEADFICLNFANPDMVGHTGIFEAAVKACETVDECAKAVTESAVKNGYTAIIIADHGNADKMLNADGSPHTAHTTALVPIILIEPEPKYSIKDGKLGDIAPTILTLMDIPVPEEMTGKVLIS